MTRSHKRSDRAHSTEHRVLLVLPPGTLDGRRFVVTHQPIMAAYLAAAARRAGARVTVADALLEGLTPAAVAARARDVDATIVAVVPNEYRRELRLDTTLAVAAAVRAMHPPAMIGLLNGVEDSERTAFREAVADAYVDFVAVGDSEDAFEQLLRSHPDAQPPAGVIKRVGRETLEGEHRPAADLNVLAFPDWSLFGWQRYSISSHRYRRLPLLPVLGSRACPYRCDFCPQALFNTRQRHRVRTPESITAEIEQLEAKYHVREIEFYDATFATRREQALELCRLLARLSRRLSWSCNSRCDLLDDDLLAAMARAGCHRILFGVESGDQRILDATGKNLDLADVRRCFAACRNHGIETIASFVVGLPGETPETVERTIGLALELEPAYVQFHLARAIIEKPRWRESGSVMDTWDIGDEGFNGPAYLPSAFRSYDELAALHRQAYFRFYCRPRYLARRLTQMNSLAEMRRLALGGVLLLKQLTASGTWRH